MIDLTRIDASAIVEGAWLDVEVPPQLQDGTPFRIKVASTASEVFRIAAAEYRRKLAKMKRTYDDGSNESNEANAELQAELTLDWTGLSNAGQPWPCTKANAKQLYLNHTWIKDQVERFSAASANFIQALPEPSTPPETRPES